MSDYELYYDHETGETVSIINETNVPNNQITAALSHLVPEVAALSRWASEGRQGSIFERDRYVSPHNIFGEFEVARHAVEYDDIVGGIAEATEALMFSKMSIQADSDEQEDIWNQIAADINLDSRLREMWKEFFTYSQFYAAVYWGNKTYQVNGRSPSGVKRKKKYRIMAPLGLTLLDPMKIIPVGNLLFNQESLAYITEGAESNLFNAVINGTSKDKLVSQLILRPYEANEIDRSQLREYGISSTAKLWELNPKTVFRHTATRPQYQAMASVRLKGIFELLDMKAQLRQMDRATLLAGTNFIVLVKKGSDARPANATEISNLQSQVKTVARVPLIVGDHRLNVEIITPKQDFVLKPERYNSLDLRLTGRLLNLLVAGGYAAGGRNDDSIKLVKVVGRALESKRHMLRRAIEGHVLMPTYEKNDSLTVRPKLRFHPKRISLDFDPALISILRDLRDRGDLSRESILEEIDYSQFDEARRRDYEAQNYDDIFKTSVPFDSPANKRDGNNNGGGSDKSPDVDKVSVKEPKVRVRRPQTNE